MRKATEGTERNQDEISTDWDEAHLKVGIDPE